ILLDDAHRLLDRQQASGLLIELAATLESLVQLTVPDREHDRGDQQRHQQLHQCETTRGTGWKHGSPHAHGLPSFSPGLTDVAGLAPLPVVGKPVMLTQLGLSPAGAPSELPRKPVTVTSQLFVPRASLPLPLSEPPAPTPGLALASALPLEPVTALAMLAPMLLPTLAAVLLLPSDVAPSEGMLPSSGPFPPSSELPGARKLAQPAVLKELTVPSCAVGPSVTLPPSGPVAPGVAPGGCAG